jgi:hypothetical protein
MMSFYNSKGVYCLRQNNTFSDSRLNPRGKAAMTYSLRELEEIARQLTDENLEYISKVDLVSSLEKLLPPISC